MKPKIKQAIISDKIYFKESDIDLIKAKDLKDLYFTYHFKEEIYSTMSISENGWCSVPSNAWFKLDIQKVTDRRTVLPNTGYKVDITLKPSQKEVVDKIFSTKLYSGMINAPCGWGKSMVGSYLVVTNNKPSIIICHTKLLAYQWYDLLCSLMPDVEIGFIGDGRDNIQPITVGIYKSLSTRLDQLQDKFEVMLVDECHMAPANMFSQVVNGINTKVKVGLTATPFRKDGLHEVLPEYFTPNRIIAKDIDKLLPKVQVVQTDFPFKIVEPKRDWSRAVNRLMTNNTYLDLIADYARGCVSRGRCVLVLGERVEALKQLQNKLARSALLVGATKQSDREDILQNAGTKYDIILSTKIFDEGISCHRLDTLILTCPSNNPAKLEQRIGRIQREHPDKKEPLIIDFWLSGNIVQNQQKSRAKWYQKQNFKLLP